MSHSEEIYLKLSAAVLEMRAALKLARKRAEENERLPEPQRDAGRSEYILALQQLQATAQSVLDSTPEADDRQPKTKRRSRTSPAT